MKITSSFNTIIYRLFHKIFIGYSIEIQSALHLYFIVIEYCDNNIQVSLIIQLQDTFSIM